MEKLVLPTTAAQPQRSKSSISRPVKAAACILLILLALLTSVRNSMPPVPRRPRGHGAGSAGAQCHQPEPLVPGYSDGLQRAYDYISSNDFRNASVKRLSGAVQVKSESFDDLGAIGEDRRWDVMYDFARYLETAFPLIHERLSLEKVNTHGLLYTWAGSDDSLKPLLLMAHQDTVPVPPETISAWTYPPWSGEYDGKYIWGRGSIDCKHQLLAVMEAVELLVAADFKPRRTVLLSFGFDEECSGRQGAGHLAPHIHERYGDDGIAAIVDEGANFDESWGTTFAIVGTGEKGYIDVDVTIRMAGGHSSVPPDHTAIGVLGELATLIEAGQYPTRLGDENPYLSQLRCGAGHSPHFPDKLRGLLEERAGSRHTCKAKPDRLAIEAAKQGPMIKYLMQTSQAIDIVQGGVKVNALPERAQMTVNHRINIGEAPATVKDRLGAIAAVVAKKYGLELHAFDGTGEVPRSISLADRKDTLEVAPVAPADGRPFAVVAGTTRALYGTGIVVSPGIMTGNTDTRFYWDLTKHIFRFTPSIDLEDPHGGGANVHTVDERISAAMHINAVRWFTLFIRNMDEADI